MTLANVAVTSLALLLVVETTACDVATVEQPAVPIPPSRGVLVVDSNAQATNIAFLSWDGAVYSPTLLSSGATAAGFSTALSGDVVLPSEAPRFTGEAVIIDRTQSVLTWVDARTAKVRAQLSVSEVADPYDYLEVSAHKAYVLRYGISTPGDLVIVDPQVPRELATISLSEYTPGAFGPFPARFIRGSKQNQVYAILQGFSANYCGANDATLIRIDTDTDKVIEARSFSGLKTCSAAARIDSRRFVMSCSGLGLVAIPGCAEHGGAGLIVIRDDGDTLVEEARFDGDALIGAPLSETVDVAFGSHIVFGSYGDRDTGAPDRWFILDVDAGAGSLVELARAPGITLGEIACESLRGVCFGADADRETIRRFEVKNGALVESAATGFHDPYGLEPRTFGRLN